MAGINFDNWKYGKNDQFEFVALFHYAQIHVSCGSI